ncbi:inorganic diphosphatase [Breoghania sp.]|uniref:inorganic diphosphatase n=1 Tax=Breoghania sp. TaxID=2065378 RepID=UPI0026053E47|nr:inorganic diphosphatase [Breoghania sp.]MDJ0933607.1 inorganic diphosphatase [Breoghania sp.]
MMEHVFSIGDRAPDLVNAIIEIPQTSAMSRKLEIDLATGRLTNAGDVDPPVPTYWHYGCLPQTLGDEGEALDVMLVVDSRVREPGEEVAVRPIGVFIAIDGWESNDDKIIAVPETPAHAHIREIGDLAPIRTLEGEDLPLAAAMNAFLARYWPGDAIIFDGWGNSCDALRIIRIGMNRYRCAPLAGSTHEASTLSAPPASLHSTTAEPLRRDAVRGGYRTGARAV